MGADVICIKDMANLLLPMEAYSLVKRLKETVSVPIHLHTHNTTGTGDMVLLMAAMPAWTSWTRPSPPGQRHLSARHGIPGGHAPGHRPDTGTGPEQDERSCRPLPQRGPAPEGGGLLDPKVLNVDTNTLLYQVPGGMLSNLISQLKQAGKGRTATMTSWPRFPGCGDFGYPPLVTPSSQIVGTQAVMNVITGERYKTFTKESEAMLRGEYGSFPAPSTRTSGQGRYRPRGGHHLPPGGSFEPELPPYHQEGSGLPQRDEGRSLSCSPPPPPLPPRRRPS